MAGTGPGFGWVVTPVADAGRTRVGKDGLQLRLVGEIELDAVVVVDGAGRITALSPSAGALLGFDSGSAIGRDVFASIESAGIGAMRGLFDDLTSQRRSSAAFELSALRADGRLVELEAFAFGRGDEIVVRLRNVTERNERRRRPLSDSDRPLSGLDRHPDGVLVVDRDGVIVRVNQALEVMFETPRSGLLYRPFAEALELRGAGGGPTITLGGTPVRPDDHPVALCLRGRRRCLGRVVGRQRAGRGMQWIQISAQATFDRTGVVSGVVASYVDVTDLVDAEERLDQHVRDLDAVGRGVGGIGGDGLGALVDADQELDEGPPVTSPESPDLSASPGASVDLRVGAGDHPAALDEGPTDGSSANPTEVTITEPSGTEIPVRESIPALVPDPSGPEFSTRSPSWLRSASLLSLATVVISLGNYAFSLVVVRLLRPEDFSRFTAAQSVLLVLANGGMAAIPWAVAHYVVQEDGPRARSEALSFGLRASVLLSIAAAGMAELLLIGVAGPAVASMAAVGAALMFMVAGPVGYLQGTDRVGSLARFRGVEAVVRIGSGLVVVLLVSRTAPFALIGFPLGAAVMLVISVIACRDGFPLHRPDGQATRKLIRQSVKLGAVQLVVVSLGAIDAVAVLASHLAPTTSASYLAASLIGRIPLFISNAVAIAAFAALTAARDDRDVGEHLRPMLRFYAVLTVPVVVGCFTVPHRLLFLLIPSSYSLAPSLLKYLCISGAAIGLINCISTVHQARGRFKAALVILVPAALVQPILLIGLGRSAGITGFCIGLVSLSCVTAVVLTWDGRRWLRLHRPAASTVLLTIVTVVLAVAAGRVQSTVEWFLLMAAVTGSTAATLLRRRAKASGIDERAKVGSDVA